MALKPIQRALEKGLVPLIHGDVAIDEQRGGTIISTEDVMVYLATQLHPARILLAGEMEGVLDEQGHVISHISPATFDGMRMALGGSHGTDVTGGMINKVSQMLALCETVPGLVVQIFSGASPGTVFRCLTDDQGRLGTVLTA
jgi:isopentenyl phosphate kinase